MQLPQDLHHFPHPTLIIVANHFHADFWLAHNDQLDELHMIDMPEELKSDNEAAFVNTDHGYSSSGPEPHDDDRMMHFEKAVAEEISHVMRDKKATAFHLVADQEVAGPIMERLAGDVAPLASWPVHADLVKSPVLDAVKRVVEKYV